MATTRHTTSYNTSSTTPNPAAEDADLALPTAVQVDVDVDVQEVQTSPAAEAQTAEASQQQDATQVDAPVLQVLDSVMEDDYSDSELVEICSVDKHNCNCPARHFRPLCRPSRLPHGMFTVFACND